MLLDAVLGGHDSGDAALGVSGVGFGECGFGDEGYLVSLGELEGGDQAGDAGADDDDVHGVLLPRVLDVRARR